MAVKISKYGASNRLRRADIRHHTRTIPRKTIFKQNVEEEDFDEDEELNAIADSRIGQPSIKVDFDDL